MSSSHFIRPLAFCAKISAIECNAFKSRFSPEKQCISAEEPTQGIAQFQKKFGRPSAFSENETRYLPASNLQLDRKLLCLERARYDPPSFGPVFPDKHRRSIQHEPVAHWSFHVRR
jgi:hypothetical protein